MAYRGGGADDERTPVTGTGETGGGGVSFEIFFEGWLVRQNQYLEQLRSAVAVVVAIEEENHITTDDDDDDDDDKQLKTLISKVLSHYQQYYESKSMVSSENVFILFAPPWLNPYEKTYLWIAGFKPGLALKVINFSVKDLSEEQKKSINQLTGMIRAREKELNDELALIQESLASARWVNLARRAGRLIDGENLELEAALLSLKEAMESLVVSADYLRITTATKLVDILNPCQTVRFLAAATQLQVSIRMLGSRREAAAAAAAASAAHSHHTAPAPAPAPASRNNHIRSLGGHT